MKLSKDLHFDKRLVDRNIEKGIISREEYDKAIADLPDLDEVAVSVDVGASPGRRLITRPVAPTSDSDR